MMEKQISATQRSTSVILTDDARCQQSLVAVVILFQLYPEGVLSVSNIPEKKSVNRVSQES